MKKTTSILVLLAAVLGISASAQVRPRVYINPGHGGHTSNDRNVVVPGYVAGDTAGFWESNASLKKGFALQELLKKKGARSVRICTMLLKPDVYDKPDKLDYVGMEIPNNFIVGYGLDYNEIGRNLPDIYTLKK